MATIDYEKKYKEALEKARQLCAYPTTNPFISDLQDLFPELAESEDERIRKEIMELVMQPTWKTENEFHRRNELCTWLEKQGQVKESLISQHENKMCKENNDSLTSEDERIRKEIIDLIEEVGEDDNYHVYCFDDMLSWLEKQAKQKPVGFNIGDEITVNGQVCRVVAVDNTADTREYDFHGIKFIPKFTEGDVIRDKKRGETTTIRDFSYDSGLYTHTYGQFPITIQDNYEKIKSTAWSEEDDYNLQCCIAKVQNDIDNGRIGRNGELLTWLKSLKDRIQPQPKQEWKPSEEQMEALESATENCAYSEYQDCLRGLIGQLKKLREE